MALALMSESYGEGGGEEKEEELYTISQTVIISTKAYYDGEDDINVYEKALSDQVFETPNQSFFEWGHKDLFLARPELFNKPPFTTQMGALMRDARPWLRLFGFVPMWTLKNVEEWVQAYLNADSVLERETIGLPFGILASHEFVLRMMRSKRRGMTWSERLDIRPVDEAQDEYHRATSRHRRGSPTPRHHGKNVTYHVYNHSATFILADNALVHNCHCRVARYFGTNPAMSQIMEAMRSSVGAQELRVPKSAFYELQTQRDDLQYLWHGSKSANFMANFPRPILNAVVPDTIKAGQNVQRTDLYSGQTMHEAALQQQQQAGMIMAADAFQLVESVKRTMGASPEGKAMTAREITRMAHSMPDNLEDAQIFHGNLEVLHMPSPAVLVDHSLYLKNYKDHLRLVMGIGGAEMLSNQQYSNTKKKATSSTSLFGGGGNGEESNGISKQLIEQEQSLYQRIVAHIFLVAFGDYDLVRLSDMAQELDRYAEAAHAQLHAHQAKRSDALQLIRDSLNKKDKTPEMIKEEEAAALKEEEEKEAREEREGKNMSTATLLKDILPRINFTRRAVHNVLQRMQLRTAETTMKLVFETTPQERPVEEKTQTMRDLFSQGAVAAPHMQKHLRDLYGDDPSIVLREPPKEKKEAPKPPKKKKKKKKKPKTKKEEDEKRGKKRKRDSDSDSDSSSSSSSDSESEKKKKKRKKRKRQKTEAHEEKDKKEKEGKKS
jgi:hypothetical protein